MIDSAQAGRSGQSAIAVAIGEDYVDRSNRGGGGRRVPWFHDPPLYFNCFLHY